MSNCKHCGITLSGDIQVHRCLALVKENRERYEKDMELAVSEEDKEKAKIRYDYANVIGGPNQ